MTFDDVIRDTFPTQTELDDFSQAAFVASWQDNLLPNAKTAVQIGRHRLATFANDPANHEV
jgi:hypothetical protein